MRLSLFTNISQQNACQIQFNTACAVTLFPGNNHYHEMTYLRQ